MYAVRSARRLFTAQTLVLWLSVGRPDKRQGRGTERKGAELHTAVPAQGSAGAAEAKSGWGEQRGGGPCGEAQQRDRPPLQDINLAGDVLLVLDLELFDLLDGDGLCRVGAAGGLEDVGKRSSVGRGGVGRGEDEVKAEQRAGGSQMWIPVNGQAAVHG